MLDAPAVRHLEVLDSVVQLLSVSSIRQLDMRHLNARGEQQHVEALRLDWESVHLAQAISFCEPNRPIK